MKNTLRLWSLHPLYLDTKGLNGIWREGLLAQAVLLGRTSAWKNHSHLVRFRNHADPISAIGFYLTKILDEANKRGYKYNRVKIIKPSEKIDRIDVTKGQLFYELNLLMKRLRNRDSQKYEEILGLNPKPVIPTPHPLFILIDGDVEPWEKSYQKKKEKLEAIDQE